MAEIAGYEILECLYTSPRSRVDRAIRIADGAPVVVKRASADVVAAEAFRRAHHEFGVLRSLQGEGIIVAHEVVRDGSQIALIVECVGESLATWIEKTRGSVEEALAIAVALARALARIHAAGVVHKDVNPANIVYDPATRTVKLIDFDIATQHPTATVERVAAGTREGTLRYMAPEQTGRLNRTIDGRTDLYALGITLYHLLTGRVPFDGDALAIVHAHLAVRPTRAEAIDPRVPVPVADIVARLIEKAPEDRYQTAAAVEHDLARCLDAVRAGRPIEPFALGSADLSRRVVFPDRLYGRDAELRALHDALARASRGGVETVLVAGYSGIGKSAMVRELHAPVTARCGHYAAGKFEQLNRDVPYSAVIAALDDLIAQVLAEADTAHARWHREITEAVGGDGPLVIAVMPSIARVIGPQPAAPELDPDLAQRRLAAALSRLTQRFAGPAHPLVIFLDDMQWADAASLQLLTMLATSEQTQAVLLIQAYRDNEVDPAHPFAQTLRDYAQRGARVTRIALAPLDLVDTTALIADVVRRPAAEVAEVAEAIWRKTEGNPFFLRQFLQSLHEEGGLVFDAVTGGFHVDRSQIDRAGVTDNVADLLARKLGRLPDPTRAALTTAAAIGNRFDLAILATIAGRSARDVHEALAPALAADMIIPVGGPGRLDETSVVGFTRYRFQHDRVQEAAYALAVPSARPRLHATIGRSLLASSTAKVLDERLFDVVHHLNRGLELMVDAGERARLVELDLAAAGRAQRAGACDVAVGLLRSAAQLVTWTDQYPTCFAVHHKLAEVLASAGAPDDARATVRDALAHATPRDCATLEALDTKICVQIGQMSEAVACTRRAAALLGIELPADPAEVGRLIEADIAAIMAAIAESPPETWIDRAPMTDPDTLAVMELFTNCIPAAYQIEPPLLVLLSTKLVTLSLARGQCGWSARGYTTVAFVLWGLGQYEIGFRIARLGVDLNRRLGDDAGEAYVDFQYAAFAVPWQRPVDEAIESLRRTIGRGIECGDLPHSGYAAMFLVAIRQWKGDPLAEIRDDARRYREVAARLGLPAIVGWLGMFPWHLRTWTGGSPAAGEDEVDGDALERLLVETGGSMTVIVMLRSLRLERCYWRGDLTAALECAASIVPHLPSIPGSLYNADIRFYHCLAAIALVGAAAADDPQVTAFRADLARYAAMCPHNFRAMSALVEAELARARGDVAAAIAHHDVAIEAAAAGGFLKIEALANELAGRFWIERGKPAYAAAHYTKARDLYEHWGARGKAHELEVKRRGLGAATNDRQTTTRSASSASSLDFATVLKASQAISSEIVLDSLLVKMMDMIVENTGAQAGAIVLESDRGLLVQASKEHDGAVTVSAGIALAGARGIAEGIVHYAMRTRESVVVPDATRHAIFRSDPYVREQRPRSILCLPILHQERAIGAIYLENNFIADAFAIDRLGALGILVAQLAISIENASMFARLASYRDHLEELVAKRTQALTEAYDQLRAQTVVRERMESELRLAQKLQSVGQLAAGVAHEINTPIQYVGDSLEFLDSSFAELVGLLGTYRAAVDAPSDVLRAAEEAADIEYLQTAGPQAFARARDGIDRVAKIVRAMKAFSHPDQQGQGTSDLNAAIENTLVVAISEYRYLADIALDLGPIPDVVCHPGEIKQVLLNLIVNAAHAIGDVVAGTDQRGTITVATRLGDDHTVEISISDTGGGIPAAIADRVFDPFFTTKAVGRGTGQGLALARTAIVDRHGGTLTFGARPGGGTIFHIRLPVQGAPEPAEAPPLAAAS